MISLLNEFEMLGANIIMGKQYRVKCKGLDDTLKGIVKFNNSNFSVPYLLENETANISLVYGKDRSNTSAKLVSIEDPSKHRNTPKCPSFYKCGGCDLQHMTYEHQLIQKKKVVENLLGGFAPVSDTIGMENPYHYRNKIHATITKDRRGNIVSGIYEENSHNVIPTDKCYIQDTTADKILKTIRQLMKQQRIAPYNEDKQYGVLRHVLIKRGYNTNQCMVVLVIGSNTFPGKNNFVSELVKAHKEITTVVVNFNDKKTSMVLGDKEVIAYGKGYIEDTLCGCTFRISPKSFYQVNPLQTEKLYSAAIDCANLTGKETVLDAYCGIGTISLIASKHAKEVIGVELNKSAVKDAKQNATINNIKNVTFYEDDAGEFMKKYTSGSNNKAKPSKDSVAKDIDVVFVDPPRSGCDEKFLTSLGSLSPKQIIYISCNPVTQKRDLDYLTKKGYKVKKIQPVDMFPWTKHIETVVHLTHV